MKDVKEIGKIIGFFLVFVLGYLVLFDEGVKSSNQNLTTFYATTQQAMETTTRPQPIKQTTTQTTTATTQATTQCSETATKKQPETTTKKKVQTTTKKKTTTTTTTTQPATTQTNETGNYYTIKATITTYCSCAKCCGKWAYNRPKDENGKDIIYTASGKRAVAGYTVGAASCYPFGTKVEIPEVGICEVMDRGSGVKSANHFDLYFSSHQEALNFGRRVVEVKVYT